MEIINEKFEIGQRFCGMTNGEVLAVVNIRLVASCKKFGKAYPATQTLVDFRSEKTGNIYQREFESAKRLLIKSI